MNNEGPFAQSAQHLRLIVGSQDVTTLAKNSGVPEQKLRDALAGKVGLESDEIDKITASPARASVLKTATANDRRHALNKPASS